MLMKILFSVILLSVICFCQDTLNNCARKGKSQNGSQLAKNNVLKNRNCKPDTSIEPQVIDIWQLLNSTDKRFVFDTSKVSEIVGYIVCVENTGPESCNCLSNNSEYQDTHICICPDSLHTLKNYIVIAEITPRLRWLSSSNHSYFTTDNIKKLFLHRYVKIKGWLFYDMQHSCSSFNTNPGNKSGKNWRGTCWEIHPIISIDIYE